MSSQQETFKGSCALLLSASFDVLPGTNHLLKVGNKHTDAHTHTQLG